MIIPEISSLALLTHRNSHNRQTPPTPNHLPLTRYRTLPRRSRTPPSSSPTPAPTRTTPYMPPPIHVLRLPHQRRLTLQNQPLDPEGHPVQPIQDLLLTLHDRRDCFFADRDGIGGVIVRRRCCGPDERGRHSPKSESTAFWMPAGRYSRAPLLACRSAGSIVEERVLMA